MSGLQSKKKSYWYFGGLASAGAACVTHPLDLIKVQLQTQQKGKISIGQLVVNIFKNQGITAFYAGLSASLCRQLTYSTTRFGVYEVAKQAIEKSNGPAPGFVTLIALASASGAAGGFVGTPADMVNVRMQNDGKLAPELRRNYRNVFHGLYRVFVEEGVRGLFSGASTATARAILMTVGQIAFYDAVKGQLLKYNFKDNTSTHFLASLTAGAIATTMTQPLDVIKTRSMNAKPGEFKNVLEIIYYTAKLGPMGFFKGYIPAFVRLGPHTILTFIFLEQLRMNFGFVPKS
ncbi:mitochondrial dicarboxylate carrier-like [Ctenocephalides felis]|uniref:mitochondrial dicarboxylate carrier-like n=1 Tax=Ctenocephalides felis TaxID=7515 RepID=UPI000E6E580B|nr:mitochondrial dicarboxylate carrier-like [Ctenocephalides felis]XP_026468920.1 mitochondrial dicarboxylate carrier-like [Ctenocephalides felis]XP_026475819.1 mitochondrial dicarboxylate carrier-like [Ctenocephalides felis]XP_026475820.1 mitochondrial dicarboxylate carrier-like [Ctenocephalides felis]